MRRLARIVDSRAARVTVAFVLVALFLSWFVVPAGTTRLIQTGHCYHVEADTFGRGQLYREIPCPPRDIEATAVAEVGGH